MKEYLDCLRYVMDNGVDTNDRTGIKFIYGRKK